MVGVGVGNESANVVAMTHEVCYMVATKHELIDKYTFS